MGILVCVRAPAKTTRPRRASKRGAVRTAALPSRDENRWTDDSPPRGEERAQQRRRLGLADPAENLGPMVAGRGGEELDAVLDCAALGIGRTEIKPADARERDRAGAHG